MLGRSYCFPQHSMLRLHDDASSCLKLQPHRQKAAGIKNCHSGSVQQHCRINPEQWLLRVRLRFSYSCSSGSFGKFKSTACLKMKAVIQDTKLVSLREKAVWLHVIWPKIH